MQVRTDAVGGGEHQERNQRRRRTAASTIPQCVQSAFCVISTVTDDMALVPASIGVPRGVMPGSSLAGERRARSMSIPISAGITPPAILNAGRVMPTARPDPRH